jgi:hypothetical protein
MRQGLLSVSVSRVNPTTPWRAGHELDVYRVEPGGGDPTFYVLLRQVAAPLGTSYKTLCKHMSDYAVPDDHLAAITGFMERAGARGRKPTQFTSLENLLKYMQDQAIMKDTTQIVVALDQLKEGSFSAATPTPRKSGKRILSSVGSEDIDDNDDEKIDEPIVVEYPDSSVSASASKRARAESPLAGMQAALDAFLVKLEERVADAAIRQYQDTPAFQQRIDALVEQVERDLVRQLTPEITVRIERELRAKKQPVSPNAAAIAEAAAKRRASLDPK